MKAKIEFTDGSVKVDKVDSIVVDLNHIFNELYYQFNDFEDERSYRIDEISRVTVDNEVIYDNMGRKENHKKEV